MAPSLLSYLASVPVAAVLPYTAATRFLKLDFSASNLALQQIDLDNTGAFCAFVAEQLAEANAEIGVGGYNEERIIYGSPVFTTAEPRTIHLGIDLWASAGTPVFAPLPGIVHSFADNAAYRDYGPTIILEHKLQGHTFYTLFGHLSRASLTGLYTGKEIRQGSQIATLGEPHENVQWPPHLHFQLITDLLGKQGDFFGVAPQTERERFVQICPNPNLLLRIPALG